MAFGCRFKFENDELSSVPLTEDEFLKSMEECGVKQSLACGVVQEGKIQSVYDYFSIDIDEGFRAEDKAVASYEIS